MNTYTDIILHIVFSVKYRDGVIGKYWKSDLHAYMASVFIANGHHPIIIGGIEDHVHCLIEYNPKQSIPEMVREVKTSATNWINCGHFTMCRFAWQKGYGAFSLSKSHIDQTRRYIANQEQHHHGESFRDEVARILRNRNISFDEKYLPEDME